MNGEIDEQIPTLVRQILNLLVQKRYEEVARLTGGIRLDASAIRGAIQAYGREVITPPDEAWHLMRVVEVRNSRPSRWVVVMPLWTREEGRSDLSLELTVFQEEGHWRCELDDLHVL